jgi:membrane-associated phospholipid phosphatase
VNRVKEWIPGRRLLLGLMLPSLFAGTGCVASSPAVSELTVRDAIHTYRTANAEGLDTARPAAANTSSADAARDSWSLLSGECHLPTRALNLTGHNFTLGMWPQEEPAAPESQPSASRPAAERGVPEGYWRQDIWHQMGHEAKALGGHDFWRGFKTSFWDLENALVLTATMGASVAIRETGVDDAIRRRTRGHRQLGELDETIQILGNPATHFAGTGVLWLTSALTKDAKQHEVAKALTQALAVNGTSTLLLKAAANTRAPDNERYAWPSGHTSSAFTVAAVLNEYYGPWVGVPSLALAGLVGYQRLDSRVHDFSDVVFGAMLGYVVGTSIARDEKAQFPEIFGMTVVPFADPETGASGLALMKSW